MKEKPMANQNSETESDMLVLFLDGLLSEEEQSAFLENSDPNEIAKARAIQDEIDSSLKSLYQFEPFDAEQEHQIARQVFENRNTEKVTPASRQRDSESVSRRRFAIAALAASLLAMTTGGMWLMNRDSNDPFFASRSVAALYQETVNAGFRPYYNCVDDEQRFAETFKNRQGKALALTEMPGGTRMLGLSYPGGISRNTTAMLGMVDDHKVIVFVDQAGAGKVDTSTPESANLNVFVVERDGLVFAEVTPLNSATLIQYFEVIPSP
jgi:anti-sigma factor RsiW